MFEIRGILPLLDRLMMRARFLQRVLLRAAVFVQARDRALQIRSRSAAIFFVDLVQLRLLHA